MVGSLLGALGMVAVLAAAFALVRWRWPAVRLPAVRARAVLTDLIYWVLGPLIVRPVVQGLVVALAAAWALLVTRHWDPQAWVTALSSRSPIGAQPLWLQAIEFVLLADFLGYWIHRAFHGAGWWRFHAIHHSSTRMTWFSSVRMHPVNDLLGATLRVLPLFLLGFRLDLLAGYLPGTALFALLLHANVRWDFGPLRYVIVSPAFHRRHHAIDGHARNFAGLLPVWDLIFGTFDMPRTTPAPTGVRDPVPPGVVGQLLYPWREGARGSAAIRVVEQCDPPSDCRTSMWPSGIAPSRGRAPSRRAESGPSPDNGTPPTRSIRITDSGCASATPTAGRAAP